MVEKVWVGKKVQVLSLEELEKNHFKDEDGFFWYSENECITNWNNKIERLKYGVSLHPSMKKFCRKICEVSEVREDFFKIKEDEVGWNWGLGMVKELISIQDVLNSD